MLYFEVNPDERESRLSFANLGKNPRFSTFTQQKNQIANRFSLSFHCSSCDNGENGRFLLKFESRLAATRQIGFMLCRMGFGGFVF